MKSKKTNLQKSIRTVNGHCNQSTRPYYDVILDEDFVPFIIPEIYIKIMPGKKYYFQEGYDSFLNAI